MLYINIIIGILTVNIQIITVKLPIIILMYKTIRDITMGSSSTGCTPLCDTSLESWSHQHANDV